MTLNYQPIVKATQRAMRETCNTSAVLEKVQTITAGYRPIVSAPRRWPIVVSNPVSRALDPKGGLIVQHQNFVTVSTEGIEDIEINTGDLIYLSDEPGAAGHRVVKVDAVRPDGKTVIVWKAELES